MLGRRGRDRLEQRSLPVLMAVRRVPKWVLFLVVLGCVAGGLSLTGLTAALLLGIVSLFLVWLLALAWPQLVAAQRLLRALTIALVGGAAIWRLFA